jgi:rhodanese-related sulfurtransferase
MQQVPVRQLQTLIEGFAADARPVLLDVREPWEVQTASLALPGARTLAIPMNEVPHRLGELDAAQPVLSLCHHGMRSLQVAAFLERQGFTQVFNVVGGIDAWSCEVDASVPRY